MEHRGEGASCRALEDSGSPKSRKRKISLLIFFLDFKKQDLRADIQNGT